MWSFNSLTLRATEGAKHRGEQYEVGAAWRAKQPGHSAVEPLWASAVPRKGALDRRAVERKQSSRVEFIGAVKEVERFYLNSHLFYLPSRWEGFPNALAEAMAHGLPVVGYAGCAGVRQIISDGQTGSLALGNGSVDSLAETLMLLMKDDARRQSMGAAAASMKPFAPQVVFDRWDNLFREVSGRP